LAEPLHQQTAAECGYDEKDDVSRNTHHDPELYGSLVFSGVSGPITGPGTASIKQKRPIRNA
jgi:hypothetical protein